MTVDGSSSESKKQATNDRQKSSGVVSYFFWLFLSALVIGLDQVSKFAIIKWVDLYDRIPVTDFLNITHQRNEGAAFSFLADADGWQRYFFITIGFVVSLVIIRWLWTIRQTSQWVLSAGLALVMGGALGNVIDRIIHGNVVDFIQVWFGNWAYPSFNVADSAITLGAILLIIDAIFLSKGKVPG